MTKRITTFLQLFSLFGVTMWFFGNLYEAIVIVPNLLTNPIEKLYHWQGFFTTTNPIFFYIPLSPIATITTFILYFKTSSDKKVAKGYLGYASIFLSFALGIGIYIITQINLKLFFGKIEGVSVEKIYALSTLWNSLNIVRVILLALTIYYLFSAYILSVKNKL